MKLCSSLSREGKAEGTKEELMPICFGKEMNLICHLCYVAINYYFDR